MVPRFIPVPTARRRRRGWARCPRCNCTSRSGGSLATVALAVESSAPMVSGQRSRRVRRKLPANRYGWSVRVGYARVRPDPRDGQGQREALAGYDVERYFFDLGRTGANMLSDELGAAVAAAGGGGEIAVTKLSRLARSLAELNQVLIELVGKDIGLRVGSSVFDLRSADQLLTAVIGVAADFDADLAVQRATEGWRTARTSGQLPGRKPALTPEQEAEVVASATAGASVERLAAAFGVGRSTIYRIVAKPMRPEGGGNHP